MKKLLATASFAVIAAQAFAADTVVPAQESARQISGYGEIYGGGFWIDELAEDTFWAAGGAARVNVPFAERWNAQGDFIVDAVGDGDARFHGVGGALHLNWRDPAAYAVGGFGEVKTYGFSQGGPDGSMSDWKVGPEAQVYFGNVTLYGQAYYGRLDIEDAPNIDLMGIRGVVRYFAQENLRFDAEVGFHRLSVNVPNVDANIDTIALALQAMYRFTDTPWSAFGRYQYANASFSGSSENLDTHKLMAGLRASFGSTTLLDEDRNGATMDTYRAEDILSLLAAPATAP